MTSGITVVSQSPGEISVLCPPDGSNMFFLYFGAVAILIAGVIFYKQRSWALCSFALLPGLFALVLGVWALTSVTAIDASAETGMLTVRYTVAGISVSRRMYRLTEVEGFRVGFMRGGRYLYADLASGNAPQLLPTSYRGGYQHAADALNSFLVSIGARTPEQIPSQ
jgi:hypothetical protein